MAAVCVFCGSAVGNNQEYLRAAVQLGTSIAASGASLVYGGGAVGIMKVLADAVLSHGGGVTGILPRETVGSETPYEAIDDIRWTESLCERKSLMESLADVFIAFPGGVGTIDELLQVWSRRRMRLHTKPIGLLNIGGFYDRFLEFFEYSNMEGFVRENDLAHLIIENDAEFLVNFLLEKARN